MPGFKQGLALVTNGSYKDMRQALAVLFVMNVDGIRPTSKTPGVCHLFSFCMKVGQTKKRLRENLNVAATYR